MGFFSGVTKTLFGGSDSTQSSQSKSGFSLLPSEIQNTYKTYATGLNDAFANGAANGMFTPLAQTQYEDNALNILDRGITPTAETLSQDINMQMNPFNEHVIDGINREAAGDYSILKGALNEAGQFGSNRQILGANDIENTRLNMIGRFKQDQYNQALNNSLTTLADSRARDVGLNFGAGEFLRNLDLQTKQAPINALSTFGNLITSLPQSGGSESTGMAKSSQRKGSMDAAAGAAMAMAMSDKRLKENIEYYDTNNGYRRYKFNYKWASTKFIGVIAQEIIQQKPDAVYKRGGYYGVDYSKLGFEMEIAND